MTTELTDEEKLLLLLLARRPRNKEAVRRSMEARNRRIVTLASSPGPLLYRLTQIVATELRTLGRGAVVTPPEAKALNEMAGRLSGRIARAFVAGGILHDIEHARTVGHKRTLADITADTLAQSTGEVVKLVAKMANLYVQRVSERDDKVCHRCQTLDGEIYPANEAPELIIHPNCRCAYVAVAARFAA